MTRLSLSAAALATLLTSAAAQTAPPAPAPVTTLRASTRIVVLDVVVSDKKGHPVHGLAPADFTVLESGKPQTIRHLEEHTPANAPPPPPLPKLGPGTFTNYSLSPSTAAVNVVLLDSLNTPLEGQAYVRQEINKYLQGLRPGTEIAVFGLNQQLRLLQGFSSDPDMLRAALTGKASNLQASEFLENSTANSATNSDVAMQQVIDNLGNSPFAEQIVGNFAQFTAERASFNLQLRTRITLESLNALGRYLSGFPGRKNLIWFSGSFPLNVLPDGDLKYPFAAAESMADEFRDTTDILARSQVAVYPIDARGLFGSSLLDATSNTADTYGGTETGAATFAKSQTAALDETSGGQSTMLMMAQATGGKAFVNTNDLHMAVAQAVDAGSNFYTLSYSPADRDWHGEYRKLEVKLAAKGLNLAYRRGYYADDPDSAANKTVTARAGTVFDPMRVSMQLGGPDPTEIILTATVRPTSAAPEPDLAPGNKLLTAVPGPYRRYTVSIKAEGKDVSAAILPDGAHHVDLGFATFLYNSKGKLINSVGSRVSADVSPANYETLLHNGVIYTQEISVPVTGAYTFRIGVHDSGSDHVGALEIPVARVARMRPLSLLIPPKP